MTKRNAACLAAAVAAAALVTISFRKPSEPSYDGRPLSAWLELYVFNRPPGPAAASNAVNHIGTNAVPYLLGWMEYETAPWRIRVVPRVPRRLLPWLLAAGLRADNAARGFHLLGSNAEPAMPALVAMARSTNAIVARRAVLALLGIEHGVEVLLQGGELTFERRTPGGLVTSAQAENDSRWMSYFGQALADPDRRVRSNAATALRILAPDLRMHPD